MLCCEILTTRHGLVMIIVQIITTGDGLVMLCCKITTIRHGLVMIITLSLMYDFVPLLVARAIYPQSSKDNRAESRKLMLDDFVPY